MYPQPTCRKGNLLAPVLIGCCLVATGGKVVAGEKELLADVLNYQGFETLREALETTPLQEMLVQRRDSTLLAPSNEAFERLADGLGCENPAELLTELDANGLLEEVLGDHFTDGDLSAQDLLTRGEIELSSGRLAAVSVGATGVTVRGTFNGMLQSAPAVTAELAAKNGSVLAISDVVLNIDPMGICDYDPNAPTDQIVFVDGNREVTITGADSTSVGLHRSQAVGGNESVSIGADRAESIAGSELVSVGGDRDQGVQGNDVLSIGANRNQQIGGDDTLSVGHDFTRSVGADESLSVGVNRDKNIGGNESINVNGSRVLDVGKTRSQSIGSDDTLNVGKDLVINAGDSITLSTGKASITMKKDGTIVIDGKDISVTGSGEISIKAGGNLVLKGTKIIQN